MKPRMLEKTIRKAMKTFPAVVVTGPRQSGKTTLLKTLFSQTHRFVSLENPDIRLRAKNDPLEFLSENPAPVIVDEIQYMPELLSYIKTKIDENREPGQWLFTGSQNFVLMEGVSQSLAGRAAILSLLPFSLAERLGHGKKSLNPHEFLTTISLKTHRTCETALDEILLRGEFPEIAVNRKVDRGIWCASYIASYLERDVRNIANIGDLRQFEQFLKLCAIRTGQLLHLSEMARDIGISVPTAKRWLSILEASFTVFLLPPYFRNIGKRLVKSPKLYFTDPGLASFLLGLDTKATLYHSPSFGALFETLIVTDFWKRYLHAGKLPSLYYIRTRDGLEIDLVIEDQEKLHLFEIKSGKMITPSHAISLLRLKYELPDRIASISIISGADQNVAVGKGVLSFSWKNVLGI